MKSQNITRKPFHPNRSRKPNSSPPVDERLFLRLEQVATERLISPYPLLLQLRKFLGENAALLKEVQHVPSGLALRPSSDTASPRPESLFSEGIKEGRLRGALGIEKAQNLVTYLLSSIPRSYTAFNDADELTNFPITAEHVCSELKEEKGLTPVAAFETRTSLDSPHSYTARYQALVNLDRAIIPGYKTTSIAALLREVWLKPAHILLEETRLNSAVRLATADTFYPLVIRSNDSRAQTRLTVEVKLVVSFPRPQLEPSSYRAPPLLTRAELSSEEASQSIRDLPPWDIPVFSDGSKQNDGAAGADAVYDSEIIGALAGLKAAVTAASTHLASSIHVILDNQEAARRLLDATPPKTSQQEILEFRHLASQWPSRRILPTTAPGKVRMMWSPGHVGILGNELADKLAGEVARLPAPAGASLAGSRS
ncbi:hypothetical protein K3495_g13760 [Podosphaera aphanis]|nr:hypothetical protein K3495_g13760 [Podosphaera aphanis]